MIEVVNGSGEAGHRTSASVAEVANAAFHDIPPIVEARSAHVDYIHLFAGALADVGDVEPARWRIEGIAKGVAQTDGPVLAPRLRRARPGGVVGWNRIRQGADVEPQQLTKKGCRVLSIHQVVAPSSAVAGR